MQRRWIFDVGTKLGTATGISSKIQPYPQRSSDFYRIVKGFLNSKRAHTPSTNKRPGDSYLEGYLRFSNPQVFAEYVNPYGSVRFGKILEDLDALAAFVSFLHADKGDDKVPTVVTASVDRIEILESIPTDIDVQLSGHVTYVGQSSMEVSLQMMTCPEGSPPEEEEGYGMEAFDKPRPKGGKTILNAKFIMVAVDPETKKGAPVPPLRLETDKDRALFESGAAHKARKQFQSQTSLNKQPPTIQELELIHNMYLQANKGPTDAVFMKDTIRKSLILCQPQERNMHNNIFGGFLMRVAMELGYATAILYCHGSVHFKAMDEVSFWKPVSIGSLLSLTAQVVYTSDASKSVQVTVIADVLDVQQPHKRETTNIFHMTFEADGPVPKILPQSYEESMKYIDGKRRRERWHKQF
ncbi:HotDog domain-containing protein [Gorgonomyces haynaldii]|nr:HotDog domain-containing protein [Gorgonomyces haynaldii]